MEATIDYEPIVTKLLEKSREGRLNWEKDPLGQFACRIEGEYVFTSKTTEDGYGLTMEDSEGNVIFSITAEQDVVFAEPKQEELFNMLRDIYQLARKKALNVDEKIATAAGLLDRV